LSITSVFTSDNYWNSAQACLREHLLGSFPSSEYIITFEPPTVENLKKAIIYLSPIDTENLDRLRTRRNSKSLQRKELSFSVTLVTSPSISSIPQGAAHKVRQMAATFERNAILRDGYKLADAGLKHANITPFTDVVEESEQSYFRKVAILTVTVYIEAS